MQKITHIELTVELLDTDEYDAEIERFAAGIIAEQFDETEASLKVEYSNQVPYNNLIVYYENGKCTEAHLDTGFVHSIAR